ADIDECIAYVDAIRSRGTDDRDVVETTVEEEVESSTRGTVEVDPMVRAVMDDDDVHESLREDVLDYVTADGAIEVTYETLGDLVQRFHDHTIEILVYRIQPLNFKGMEGVVGLTCWFKKMEIMFHISYRPSRYQVKYASFTLLDSALTWWNSHKRKVGVDVAYAMTWKALIKLMTEMVPEEEDKVEKYIGVLPDNIQGNVIVVEPTRLQDVIRVANNLMDQKLKGYAIKMPRTREG
ncbi:hypothetical protein Tco_1257094, partial [Tanacetum coccineum]